MADTHKDNGCTLSAIVAPAVCFDEAKDASAAASRLAVAVRATLEKITAASGGDMVTLLVIMLRINGLSYSDIGAKLKMTKQAVFKHIQRVEKQNPQFADFLKAGAPVTNAPEVTFYRKKAA
jgi:hypothetical protein